MKLSFPDLRAWNSCTTCGGPLPLHRHSGLFVRIYCDTCGTWTSRPDQHEDDLLPPPKRRPTAADRRN